MRQPETLGMQPPSITDLVVALCERFGVDRTRTAQITIQPTSIEFNVYPANDDAATLITQVFDVSGT